MIGALALLLVCQLLGEGLARVLALPVPGPVIGLLLLLAWLFARGGVPEDLERVTATLLGNLSLLFVPAGVGVLAHWPAIRDIWPALALALLGSTLLALAVTAWTLRGVEFLQDRQHRKRPHG